jgi:acetone carboxylase gamma subunit
MAVLRDDGRFAETMAVLRDDGRFAETMAVLRDDGRFYEMMAVLRDDGRFYEMMAVLRDDGRFYEMMAVWLDTARRVPAGCAFLPNDGGFSVVDAMSMMTIDFFFTWRIGADFQTSNSAVSQVGGDGFFINCVTPLPIN